jgi:hypothetical protein
LTGLLRVAALIFLLVGAFAFMQKSLQIKSLLQLSPRALHASRP